jgi:hypothetical protein
MPRRSQPEPPSPRFLLDRSLGSKLVPRLLREAGFDLLTLADVYGEAEAQRSHDEVWLAYAGEHDLVVLGADDRIRYRAHERNAMSGGALRSFTIKNAQITGEVAASWYVKHQHRILRLCRKPGPYVYGVYEDRVERLWSG